MDSIFTSPEFQMSLLTTLITPIVYRNWFFHGEYSGYDKNWTCIDESKWPASQEQGDVHLREMPDL